MKQHSRTSAASLCSKNLVISQQRHGASAMVTRYTGLLLLFAMVLMLPQATTAQMCSTTQSGLIALYRKGASGTDAVGFNVGPNNPTVVGNPANVQDMSFGNVLQLNGNGQYLQLPYGFLQDTATFTVSIWFKANSAGGVLFAMQDTPYGTTPTTSASLLYVGTDGKLYITADLGPGPGTFDLRPAAPIADGAWHHAAINESPARTDFYLDGNWLIGLSPAAAGAKWNIYNANVPYSQIGGGYTTTQTATPGGWFSFNGVIGEVAIFNRTFPFDGSFKNPELTNLYAASGTGVCALTPVNLAASPLSLVAGSTAAFTPSATATPAAGVSSRTCYSSANGVYPKQPGSNVTFDNAVLCSWTAAAGYAVTFQPNQTVVGSPSAGGDPYIEPDAYVGIPYRDKLGISTPSGSQFAPYKFSPPPGVTLSSSGVLSGTPTQAGSNSFYVSWSSYGVSLGVQPINLKVLPGFGNLIVAAAESNYSTTGIYSVNPNNGATTLITRVPDTVEDVAVDPNTGMIYAASFNGKVFQINSSGQLLSLFSDATVGPLYAIAIDSASNIYVASHTSIYKMASSSGLYGPLTLVDAAGNATTSALMANPVSGTNPPRMIFDGDGNLLISGDSGGNPRVDSVTFAPGITTSNAYAANAPGNITGMTFARDGSGDLILADNGNNALLRVSQLHAANTVSTVIAPSPQLFNSSMVGIVAGNATPYNEYYVAESTGFATTKVVPQTNFTAPLAFYPDSHQMAITWYRYNSAAITIPPPYATNPLVGSAYSQPLHATGGTGVYTWTASVLPPGFALSPSGVLSSPPISLAPRPYTVTVQATDSLGVVGTGSFTITVHQNAAITITADNQTIVYGTALPTPTFTLSQPVVFTTPPVCSYVGLPTPLVVGTYTNAIQCVGGAATGYSFQSSPGTLSVTAAPLTVTADNITVPFGVNVLPTLTATITGFVNNDTAATAVTGSPALSVSVPSGNPAGAYPIDVKQGSLQAANYTFNNFVPGTLTIGSLAPTPQLSLMNTYILPGDYTARSNDAPFLQVPSGNVSATITIPVGAIGGPSDGVPPSAEVVAAFLYWQTLESSSSPSSANAKFNGYDIFGTSVGSDLSSGCWTSAVPGGIIRSYRSNVTAFLPVVNGTNQAVGTHTIELAPTGFGTGATLVVIWRSLDPSVPMKSTVVYDGNWAQDSSTGYTSTFNLNLAGLYDAIGQFPARMADITTLANTNGDFSLTPQLKPSAVILGDHSASLQMPNNFSALTSGQCRIWAATVLSANVHASGNDGLLDSWKTGPTLASDPNFGKPGYYDTLTGAWVDLPGAQVGQRDLFVQLDYMVGADGHSHQPSASALNQVTHAFATHGVTLHVVPGNAITEETCTTDDTSVSPTQYCVFPNEPGVVAWKVGLEDLKSAPVDSAACAADPTGTSAACQPRFPFQRRSSYHYVLFGHSLGIANWSVNDGTLANIVVSGGVGTVNLTEPFSKCPSRVTITNAMVTLELNGTYNVNSCPTSNSFTISTSNLPDGTYPASNGLPEPALAIINGTTGTISGYSDVGGSDSVITLGKWGTDASRDNVVAGTMMHELGHTLGLSHGGQFNGYGATGTVGQNCKPNYQSVMNYLFQIDLLGPNAVLDYSSEQLNDLSKGLLGTSVLGLSTSNSTAPLYSTTSWYAPIPPFNAGTPATRRCDGALPNGEIAYLVTGSSTPIAWSSGQDVNFNGQTADVLQGFNDWQNVDLREVGTTGNDVLAYPLGLSDGGIQRAGGGGIQRAGGGGIQRCGGGGIQRSGGGGIQRAGGGGIQRAGGGGIQRAGGGGIQRAGGGGIDAELRFETANAVIRPPRATVVNGNTITWSAPLFGNITAYKIYRSTNGGAPVLIATVPATQFSYTDNTTVAGNTYNYTVTTVVTDIDPNTGTPTGTRESTAPNPPTAPVAQTINFPPLGPISYSTNGIPLTATATSGLPVVFSATGNCTVTGATLFTLSTGSCTVTATQPGSSFALPATTSQTFTITSSVQATLVLNAGSPLVYNTTETLSTTGGSGSGAVSFSLSSGPCTLVGPQLKATSGTGSCVIVAQKAADNTYAVATSAPVTVTLAKAAQTITFGPLANRLFSTSTFTVLASSSSGLPISWSASGSCKVTSTTGVVTMNHYGVCTITASQPGNANYSAATSVSQSFTVGQWTIVGFASPVKMPIGGTIVWNRIKAGQTVPLKFNVYAGTTQQTNVSVVVGKSVTIAQIECMSANEIDDFDVISAATSTLKWTGSTFLQNWKTPLGAGKCYVTTATTIDGSSITAYFKTK